MTTIELLGGLEPFIRLLTVFRSLEDDGASVPGDVGRVWLSYNTIAMEYTAISLSPSGKKSLSPQFQSKFQIKDQSVLLSQTYCEDKDRKKEIENLILQHVPMEGAAWNPVVNPDSYSTEVIRYLEIADRVAKGTYLCAQGDNYYPGYFSKIIVTDHEITLEQINHWNAKSLAHKRDYHLRDLVFHIPLQETEFQLPWHDYNIGRMYINFSNRSSPNNKHCGEEIVRQIEAEKLQFESEP